MKKTRSTDGNREAGLVDDTDNVSACDSTKNPNLSPKRRDAGSITDWLRPYIEDPFRTLSEGADVPCGSCSQCCRAGYRIDVLPHEVHPRMRTRRAGGRLALDLAPDGACVHLVNGKCEIYANRPNACRTFDCRVMFFAGMRYHEGTVRNWMVDQWYTRLDTRDDAIYALGLAGAARQLHREGATSVEDEAVIAREMVKNHLGSMRQAVEPRVRKVGVAKVRRLLRDVYGRDRLPARIVPEAAA